MIKIKLIEFNVSAQDLDQQRIIFYQSPSDILPITEIDITKQKIVLLSEPNQPKMSLKQFQLQTKTANPNLLLYFKQESDLRIFGYRLEDKQIIFG